MKPHFRMALDGTFVPRASAIAGAHQGASWDSRDVKAWAPRRGTSADVDILPELGTLRDRARDIDRNNGVARGGVQTIIDNVVGTGLRLSARPDWRALGQTKEWADAWSAKVESLFCSWAWTTVCDAADTSTFDQMTAQNLRGELLNGDGIALSHWLPERGDGFSTKLQLIEGDRVSNPDGRGDSTNLRGGFEIDGLGAPLACHVRRVHPGDLMIGDSGAFPMWERVPRRTPFGRLRWIHTANRERPGQTRGKPIMTAVLAQFKNLDRYSQAELQAAVVNGMIAGIIETPLDQDNIVELFSKDHAAYLKARDERAVRLESGSMLPLFPGDKLNPFIPARPAAAFGAFIENILRMIAVALDMPYELLLKDFSKTNYSSARAAMLEAWRAFNRRRDALGTQWGDPIYALWLEEVVNDGRIDAPGFYEKRAAYQRCKWIGPGKGWVDPVKEAQAAQIRIDAGLSTLEDECAEQGRDWREVMEQLAREQAERVRLGLPDHSAVRAGSPPKSAPDDNAGANEDTAPPPKRDGGNGGASYAPA